MAGQWLKQKLERWAVAGTLRVCDHLILSSVTPQPSARAGFPCKLHGRLCSHRSQLGWHQSSILDTPDTWIILLAQTPTLAVVCQKLKLHNDTTSPSEMWPWPSCSHLAAVTRVGSSTVLPVTLFGSLVFFHTSCTHCWPW